LKSIHDVSHIHCASAEILINEAFDKNLLYDQKTGKTFNGESVTSLDGDRPIMKVLADQKLDIKVMSDFEILR